MTGAELLRSLRAEADRITALGAGLRDRIDTLTDPTAAEAEVEAVRAAADQRAATAEARAAADERVAAIAQARAVAEQRVPAAEASREQARQAAANAEAAARQAQQGTAHAQAAEQAARAEAERVRADAGRMLGFPGPFSTSLRRRMLRIS